MSERLDANKTKESHRCILCRYYYFLKVILDCNQEHVMVVMI